MIIIIIPEALERAPDAVTIILYLKFIKLYYHY